MAAIAVIVLGTALVIVLPRLSGGHAGHGGGAATPASDPAADGSSVLRLLVVGLLFGGWALAFTIGIWRRWRVTDNRRPDNDTVSDPR